MIFEDAHWADPTSLEAFGRAVDRIRTLSVLLIVTYRPEFEPPWLGRPYVTALILNRLGVREIAAIIDGITGNRLLSPSVKAGHCPTDSIPLFVEEMTKAVLETETEGEAGQTAAHIPPPAQAVPASLHVSSWRGFTGLVMRRTHADRGGHRPRVFARAIGGGCKQAGSRAGIRAGPPHRRRSAVPTGRSARATYLFKHTLVQDAAYGTLLREFRRALHARIADALETRFAGAIEPS